MIRRYSVMSMLIVVLSLGFTAFISCADPPEQRPDDGSAAGPGEGLGGSDEDNNGSVEEELREGFLLTVDGTEIAYISDREVAKEVADRLIREYKGRLSEGGKGVESIELLSTFEVVLTSCREIDITDADGTIDKLAASGLKIVYAVVEREVIPIAYETVYKNSSAYYEGTKKTQTYGKNGEKELTYSVTYTGSEETARELKGEKILKSATDQVILVGTKKSTASTGSYAWPTKSVYVTSNYGWRTIFGKREYHYGIDLRASVGTAIYAADGGEVVFVGTSGGYGKLIQIKHDNGDLTYYAHLSSYSVKKGERVYKGQQIAKSGATGRVTGPHLHFEIRKNGVRVDPAKYLPKLK